MVISYCLKSDLTIRIKGINSLKEKRSFIKRLKNLLYKNYNASVIESNFNDSHEFLTLTFAIVSKDKDYLLKLINNIEEIVEVEYGAFIIDHVYEIF